MLNPSNPSSHEKEVAIASTYEELVDYSERVLQERQSTGRLGSFDLAQLGVQDPATPSVQPPTGFLSEPGFTKIYCGAAPLAPLRSRDWAVLDALFKTSEMPDIEADVIANLSVRVPEPCWEDKVFDFLDEFL